MRALLLAWLALLAGGGVAFATEQPDVRSTLDVLMGKPQNMQENIMYQLAHCWAPPVQAAGSQAGVATVLAQFAPDGSLIQVNLTPDDAARASKDTDFRIIGQAAVNAVTRCSPLKNLPPDQFKVWQYMELRFDPKFMAN